MRARSLCFREQRCGHDSTEPTLAPSRFQDRIPAWGTSLTVRLRLLARSRGGKSLDGSVSLYAERLEDAFNAPLVNRLGKLEVLGTTALRELRPAGDPVLTGKVVHERAEVLALLVTEGLEILRDVGGNLVDEDVLLLRTELLDLLLDLAVVIEDFLTADLTVDGLREAVEGNGSLRTDVAEANGVE